MTYTPEIIREKINTNQQWLERAVLALYNRQTTDEQNQFTTTHHNAAGFNSADAGYLTYIAQWINAGKHLDGKHLDKTRTRVSKYCKQLAEIANERTENQ